MKNMTINQIKYKRCPQCHRPYPLARWKKDEQGGYTLIEVYNPKTCKPCREVGSHDE